MSSTQQVAAAELRETVRVCRDAMTNLEGELDGLATEKDILLKELVRIRERCASIDHQFLLKHKEYESASTLLKLCEEEYSKVCARREPTRALLANSMQPPIMSAVQQGQGGAASPQGNR
ncbi:unnamed protein product [Amoebophrya sp. A25]|nr:unnamed protein product [Amoebophrya sp. A25]|eukprot:GSA25T00014802001.1